MKQMKFALAAAVAVLLGLSAGAATTTFKGVTITYTGTATVDSGDGSTVRILSFKTDGTLTLPGDATADILVVGGGGGGGGGYRSGSTRYYANGGNGGQVVQASDVTLAANTTFNIGVGSGGTIGANTGADGGKGGDSSISVQSLTAQGGAGGSGGNTTHANSADATFAGTSNPTAENDRRSSISGTSTVYGNGGAKADSKDTPEAGDDGLGEGGQGGRAGNSSAYAGGKGGSGIVVVKLTDIAVKPEYVMELVKMSHGKSVSITNENGKAIAWGDVKEHETTDERIAKLVDVDGFACITNEVRDGAAEVKVVTEDADYIYPVRCMTVEIEKTVKAKRDTDPNDKSNATIRVTSHVMIGVNSMPTNTILFIGSLCANHDLATDAISSALGVLKEKGAVDYYFYNNGSSSSTKTDAADFGSIPMGGEVPTITTPGNGGHRNLVAYLTLLDQKLDAAGTLERNRKYAYVVLEFDGNRLAGDLSDAQAAGYSALAERVARKLTWYYDNERVIWIVDPAPGNESGRHENANDPTYHGGNPNNYYRPSTFYYSSGDQNLNPGSLGAWDLFVALVDPYKYLAGETRDDEVTYSSKTYKVATKNTLQAVYDDAEKVKKILDERVKVTTYAATLEDKVQDIGNSLSIVSAGAGKKKISFYTWKNKSAPESLTNEYGCAHIADLPKDSTHWAVEPESAYTVTESGYKVTAGITNLTMETWNMFEIAVVDDGTFLMTCIENGLAIFDEETDKWYLDPNDGPAEVSLYAKEDGVVYKAASDAQATMVLWEMDDPRMYVDVRDVSKVYDGIATNVNFVSVTNAAGKTVTWKTLEYSETGTGAWYPWSAAVYTDVTDGAKKIFVKATAEGYLAATNFAYVTITPAPIQTPGPGENPTEPTKPYTQAPNIVRIYNGNGSNIEPATQNLVAGNEPSYQYSFDKEGPYVDFDKLAVTNVTFDGGAITSNLVWYTVKTTPANYFSATNFAWITITQAVVTVKADNASKVYGLVDPADPSKGVLPDPAFTWAIDAAKSGIVPGEEEDVTNALKNCEAAAPEGKILTRVEEDPEEATTRGYEPEEDMNDVLKDRAPGYWRYNVITTNAPFKAVFEDGTENYRVEFVRADFALYPTNVVFAPGSDVYDYTGIYDGKPHTISLNILPGTDHKGNPTQVSFSKDEDVWTAYIDVTNETAWRAALPTYTHVTNMAPVYVKAVNVPNFYETNMVAYVTITQRTVYVTAASTNRVYNGQELTHNVVVVTAPTADTGFVSGDCFGSTEMTADSAITNVGTTNNILNTYTIAGTGNMGDYRIKKTSGTLEVTPAQILDESDKELKDRTKPWAAAADVLVWTNDCPAVTTVGTNIIVTSGLLTAKDQAKVQYAYSAIAPTNEAFAGWTPAKDFAPFKTLCSTQVWCHVSCENYLPTNVAAYVTILSKEAEVHDEKADGVDKPLPNVEMQQATSNVLDQIIANNPTSKDYNPDTLLKWEADQLDGRVHLEFTSITNLGGQAEIDATNHLQQAIASVPSGSWTDVSGRSVDVSLIYWQTFKGGEVKTNDIGGENTELIPFTLALDLSGGLEVVKVIRYHGAEATTLSKTSAGEGYSVSGSGASATITIRTKKYSEFIIITGKAYTPPPPPPPPPPADPVPLKIFVDDRTVTEGDPVPTNLAFKVGAARYECDEPVDESKIFGLDTVTFSTTYVQGSPAGFYPIYADEKALSSTYYAITVVPGVLTVLPKPLQDWLYPDGDGCQCLEGLAAQTFVGTVVSTNEGNEVIGTIDVKTSKPNRKGLVTVKATVYLRKSNKRLTYIRRDVEIECGACSLPVEMFQQCCEEPNRYGLTLVFNGNAMRGVFDGSCRIDGGVDVFSIKNDLRRTAIDDYVGIWNGAFVSEGDIPGFVLFSAEIKANSGKVASKCWLADGASYSYSSKAHIGTNDFCVIPLIFNKTAKKRTSSVGFRMTFDAVNEVNRLLSVSNWELCDKSDETLETYGELEAAAFGRPTLTADEFKLLRPVVQSEEGVLPAQPSKATLKYNEKNGQITGSMKWTFVNEAGKKLTYTGKVYGVAIGDECAANVTIKNVGTFPVTFVEAEE